MVELNWTHEAEQWLHDIYDYISKENLEAALQTIESIYKKVQILKEFPESGYCYNRNHSHHIRILLYGH
jgi:toxin ParE1/3/4